MRVCACAVSCAAHGGCLLSEPVYCYHQLRQAISESRDETDDDAPPPPPVLVSTLEPKHARAIVQWATSPRGDGARPALAVLAHARAVLAANRSDVRHHETFDDYSDSDEGNTSSSSSAYGRGNHPELELSSDSLDSEVDDSDINASDADGGEMDDSEPDNDGHDGDADGGDGAGGGDGEDDAAGGGGSSASQGQGGDPAGGGGGGVGFQGGDGDGGDDEDDGGDGAGDGGGAAGGGGAGDPSSSSTPSSDDADGPSESSDAGGGGGAAFADLDGQHPGVEALPDIYRQHLRDIALAQLLIGHLHHSSLSEVEEAAHAALVGAISALDDAHQDQGEPPVLPTWPARGLTHAQLLRLANVQLPDVRRYICCGATLPAGG